MRLAAAAAERLGWPALPALAVLLLVLRPLVRENGPAETALALLYASLCAGTVLCARSVAVGRRLGLAAPVAWFGVVVVARAGDARWLDALALLSTLWITAQVTLVAVETVLARRLSGRDALAAAAFGYLMLALAWAQLYIVMELWSPGAFRGPDGEVSAAELTHLSMVTITTLGYGDVLPVAPLARVLAGLQAMIGTLYVAVLIGRIVSELKPPGRDGR